MSAGVIDTRNFASSWEDQRKRLRLIEQQISNPDINIGAGGGGTGTSEFEEITILNPGVGDDVTISFDVLPPTGLNVVTSTYLEEIYLDASWTAPAGGSSGYEIELSRQTAPGVYDTPRVYRTIGTSVRLIVPLANTVYGVRVAAVNVIGVRSAFTTRMDVTSAIDSTIPPAVTGLSVTAGINSLLVSFARLTAGQAPDMQDGSGLYRIQLSSNDFAAIISDKYTSSNVESFSGLTQGTNYKVRVAAVDPSGNQGPYTTSSNVAPGNISSSHIADGAVTTLKIVDDAITAAKIGDNAVGELQIAADAVTTAKIAALAVGSTEIAAGAITAGKIGALAIVAGDIAADAITTSKLAANAVTAVKIAANTITANEIAANAITADELAANAVTAAKILAGTITATQIAANTITGGNILAGSVDGDRITANTLSAAAIETSTLTAADITIAGGSLRAGTPVTADGALLNSQGFKLYKDGQITVNLDALTGDASFTGNLVGSIMHGGQILSPEIKGEGVNINNILPNGNFNTNLTGWTHTISIGTTAMERVASPAVPLNNESGHPPLLRLYASGVAPNTGNGAQGFVRSDYFPVITGERYFVSAKYRGIGNSDAVTSHLALPRYGGTVEVRAQFRRADLTTVSPSQLIWNTSIPNGTTISRVVNGDIVVPAEAVTCRIEIAFLAMWDAQQFFDDIEVSKGSLLSGFALETRGAAYASTRIDTQAIGGAYSSHSITFEQMENASGNPFLNFPSIKSSMPRTANQPYFGVMDLVLSAGQYTDRRDARITLMSASPTTQSGWDFNSELRGQAEQIWLQASSSTTAVIDYPSCVIDMNRNNGGELTLQAFTASGVGSTLSIRHNQGADSLRFNTQPIWVPSSAWVNVTFQNSWVNYDSPGTGARNVQYRKVGDHVFLRGVCRSGTIGLPMFTLPTGFRPTITNHSFITDQGGVASVVQVNSLGQVTVAGGANTYVYVDVIQFSTAA